MIAFACLLLVAGASSAQATHIHGKLLPNQSTQVDGVADASQLPGGEANCPLCVAMHSALPTVVECKLATVVEQRRDSQWHFAMFSRPPPAVNL